MIGDHNCNIYNFKWIHWIYACWRTEIAVSVPAVLRKSGFVQSADLCRGGVRVRARVRVRVRVSRVRAVIDRYAV